MKKFLGLTIFFLGLVSLLIIGTPVNASTNPEIGTIQIEIFPDIRSVTAETVQEVENVKNFSKILPLILKISTLEDASPVSTIYIDNNTPLIVPVDVPVGKYRIFLKRADRPHITYEYNNNSNGILITKDSDVIVPLFSNTPLKDVLADVPPRVDTTENIPITLIVKDANQDDYPVYEIRIYDDKTDNDDDTADDDLEYTLNLEGDSCLLASGFENIDEDYWYRIVKVSQSKFSNVGGYAMIHVLFDAATICDPTDWDTHVHLSVRTSGNNLPKLPNWHCGDQHVHSWVTDDIWEFGAPVEAIRDAGKAMGIDYVIITDHSYDIDPFPNEWDNLKSDCISNSSADFICLAGEEISCDESGITEGASHLLAYGITTPMNSIGIGPDWFPDDPDQQNAIDFVEMQSGLAYLAHPFGGPDPIPLTEMWDWDDIDSSQGYTGLEVFHEIWQDEYDGRTLAKWVEYILDGEKIYGIGNSDAHDLHSLGRARTYSYTETFTEDGFLDALRNGHSIMTNGPLVIFNITNEFGETAIIGNETSGNELTLNVQWESTSEFGNVDHIYVYRGIIGETEEEIGEYYLTPNSLSGTHSYSNLVEKIPSASYIRIEATSTNGGEIYRCYTNPIWVVPISSGRSGGPDDFGYTFTDSNFPDGPTHDWLEISGTGTPALTNSDDSWVGNIDIGFFFNYYGTDYSQLAISNNGLLFSGGTTWEYINEEIRNSPSVHGFIAPYWDDIVTWGSADAIYYKTLGTAPNRMFVAEWNDNQHYHSSTSGITFEVILYEGSNNIKFQYKDVDFGTVSGAVGGDNPPYNNGGSATVGIEGPTGNDGLQYSFNEQVIDPGLAILFKFPQYAGTNLYLSKQAPASKDHGSTMTYTLHYHNFGDTAAQNVVLEDNLPSNVEVESTSAGEYDPVTDTLRWNMGTIEPGGHGYETVTVRIPESVAVGTVIVNNAEISTSNIEVRLDDNEAHAETRVTGSNLPPDVGVEPTLGGTGIPSVYWSTPITFSYHSCPTATGVDIRIHINDGGSDITGSMAGGPPEWTYTTTFYPRHGRATITYTIYGCDEETVSFDIYIDPAGYIYDVATGERIEGATVWLQRPDGTGDWENVPTGEDPPIAQPDVNPQITGPDGQYQWDVLEGSYRVHVEAPGYYPEDSIVVSIPPPVTDLHIGLTNIPLNISGYKINDTNGNGLWNAGEVGIGWWNITLKNATTGAEIANTSTDEAGFYQFVNLATGSYNVTEGIREGWMSTNATFIVMTMTDQDIMNLNFTNRRIATVNTSTGTGTAYFTSDAGTIEDLIALNESDMPEENPDIDFPHGLFKFNITGVNPGQIVNVTIAFPQDIPPTAQYWICGPNGSIDNPQPLRWYEILMNSNDGDGVIAITKQDGGIGDEDGVENGIIVDDGGPGIATLPIAAQVPTLTPVGLTALAGLLLVIGGRRSRKKRRN